MEVQRLLTVPARAREVASEKKKSATTSWQAILESTYPTLSVSYFSSVRITVNRAATPFMSQP